MLLANMYPDHAADRPRPPFKVESTCFHLSTPVALSPSSSYSFLSSSLSPLPLLFMAEFKRASWGGPGH